MSQYAMPMPPPRGAPKKGTSPALVALLMLAGFVMLGFGGCVVCVLLAPPASSRPSADLTAKLGPCADMQIGSLDEAFDKAKLGECSTCCRQKAPDANAAYYHFEGNKAPGRCRCVSPSQSGANCTGAKDFGTCTACCTQKKKSTKFDKAKGCSCE